MKKKKEELGFLKILSEKDEKWVQMEVEMDGSLTKILVAYAKDKMSGKELDALLINWSFNDVLKKQIEREKSK